MLVSAVMEGTAAQVAELLKQDKTDLNTPSADGWTPLHLAAFFGHQDIARVLLAHGADLEARSTNEMKNTPLHAAVANRKHEMVDYLLQQGAAVNATQSGGWTALHEAALHGDEQLITTLLSHGADVSLTKDDGLTPLGVALEKEKLNVIELLRQQEA